MQPHDRRVEPIAWAVSLAGHASSFDMTGMVKRLTLFTAGLLALIGLGLHAAGVELDQDTIIVACVSCAFLIGFVPVMSVFFDRFGSVSYLLDGDRLVIQSGQHPRVIRLRDLKNSEVREGQIFLTEERRANAVERFLVGKLAGQPAQPEVRRATVALPSDEEQRAEVVRRLLSHCGPDWAPEPGESAPRAMISTWTGLIALLGFGLIWGSLLVAPLWFGFEQLGISWRAWVWIWLGVTSLFGPGTWLALRRHGRAGLAYAEVRRGLFVLNGISVCMSVGGGIVGGFALIAALGLPV